MPIPPPVVGITSPRGVPKTSRGDDDGWDGVVPDDDDSDDAISIAASATRFLHRPYSTISCWVRP